MQLLLVLWMMIVLPCISQEKYRIDDTNYYCYSPEENRVIGLIFTEKEECDKLLDLSIQRLNVCNLQKITLENDIKAYKFFSDSIQVRFDNQVKLTNDCRDEKEKIKESLKTWKHVSYGTITSTIVLIIIAIVK